MLFPLRHCECLETDSVGEVGALTASRARCGIRAAILSLSNL
jgi:hypothetical protein